MAEVCDIAEESLLLSDHLRSTLTSRAAETVNLGGAPIVGAISQRVVEALTLNDGATMATVVAIVQDGFALGDASRQNVIGVNDAVQHVVIGDRLTSTLANLAAEALAFDDRATTPSMENTIREGMVFADRGGHGGVLVNRASDVVLIAASSRQQAFRMLTEAITLHSTVVDRQSIADHAMEAFVFNDRGSVNAIIANLASEGFGLGDAARQNVVGVDRAREGFYLADDANGGAPGGAWAAATETFAMSRYEHKRIEAIAVIGGILFVATQDGIFALTGAEDEDEPVDMLATTGIMDTVTPAEGDRPADSSLKRASYVYVAYSGGRMRFGIGITGSGTEERYFYDFPARTANVQTVGRTKIGRGARSRFWRFFIGNVEGDAIRVTDARVPLDPTSRRI